MTDTMHVLSEESDRRTWKTLPPAMQNFMKSVKIEGARKVKAVVSYRYVNSQGQTVPLFHEEWYDTDPPVAFVLGPQVMYGELIDVVEFQQLSAAPSVEDWVVYLAIPV